MKFKVYTFQELLASENQTTLFQNFHHTNLFKHQKVSLIGLVFEISLKQDGFKVGVEVVFLSFSSLEAQTTWRRKEEEMKPKER